MKDLKFTFSNAVTCHLAKRGSPVKLYELCYSKSLRCMERSYRHYHY